MGYGVPLAGNIHSDSLLPPGSSVAMQSDRALACNNLPLPARKRSRDSAMNPVVPRPLSYSFRDNRSCFSFLNDDVSLQIQKQQLDIDFSIYQHMEKVMLEMEEKRKRQTTKIIEAIEVGMQKRLRAKEEEIDRIGKMNWALEERVKSLFVENQILRELARTNEATANALRTNLEHLLSQTEDERSLALSQGKKGRPTQELMDDGESCCASNDGWQSGEDRGEIGNESGGGRRRWCRKCWKEEACVLVFPCRHLCLCTVCGSSILSCPVCKSTNNASLYVIIS